MQTVILWIILINNDTLLATRHFLNEGDLYSKSSVIWNGWLIA